MVKRADVKKASFSEAKKVYRESLKEIDCANNFEDLTYWSVTAFNSLERMRKIKHRFEFVLFGFMYCLLILLSLYVIYKGF